MATATSRQLRPWRVVGTGLAAPVAPRTLQALVHTVTDLPSALLTSVPVLTLFIIAVVSVPVLPLALLTFALAMATSWLFGHLERVRLAALTGTALSNPHRRHHGKAWRRAWMWLRSAATWKELGYHALHLPTAAVFTAITVAVWSVGLALALLPLYVGAVPAGEARLGWWHIGPGVGALLAAGVGVVVLWTAPWITRGLSRLALGMAAGLLSGGEAEALRERVGDLEASRAEVVDAAEAERRRIERDLHDGAQQRLVALAMGLGLAREKLDDDPEAARALIDEAHREAKSALVELRDLARGLHPPVLTDRGLAAAVAGLASRAPVPVEVDVRVERRAPPSIEGIAYFVISEALTNVARHSGARRARVSVVDQGDRLLVEVSDDGMGGASSERGTGLKGLVDRARAVDGELHVTSPGGGPTVVRALLPLPERPEVTPTGTTTSGATTGPAGPAPSDPTGPATAGPTGPTGPTPPGGTP